MIFGLQHPVTIEVHATITVRPSGITFTPDPPPVTEPPAEPETPVEPEPEPEPPAEPPVEPPSEPTGGLALEYVGACRVSQGTIGDSRPAWSTGAIGATADGFWIAGHSHHNAVGKYAYPSEWAATYDVAAMPIVGNIRPFVTIAPEPFVTANGMIFTGLYEEAGDLTIAVAAYYDGAGTNVQDMAVLRADGTQEGFFRVEGGATAAGWMQKTPVEYFPQIGEYLMGYAANIPINGRLSHGPSLFGWDGVPQSVVSTTPIMVFPMGEPMGTMGGSAPPADPLWNELSTVACAFIHGDEYIAIGETGGLLTGIGYKNHVNPDGYGAHDAGDYYPYYWRFKMADILSAANPWDARPFDFGNLNVPHRVLGGSYHDGHVYLCDTRGDVLQNPYESHPILYKYRVI